MNLLKIWHGIKIGLSIAQHVGSTGLIKSGKIIKITNVAGAVVTSVDDKIKGGYNLSSLPLPEDTHKY